MFIKVFESALNSVAGWARVKRHEFITVEHLLLALIEEPVAREILAQTARSADTELRVEAIRSIGICVVP